MKAVGVCGRESESGFLRITVCGCWFGGREAAKPRRRGGVCGRNRAAVCTEGNVRLLGLNGETECRNNVRQRPEPAGWQRN